MLDNPKLLFQRAKRMGCLVYFGHIHLQKPHSVVWRQTCCHIYEGPTYIFLCTPVALAKQL